MMKFLRSRLFSIQKRLEFIFLSFLGLLLVSVVVTFLGLEAQQKDARVINLAGRQRMLLQQISRLAVDSEYAEGNENTSSLLLAADSFEKTLAVLRRGGLILDYTDEPFELAPPSSDTALLAELDILQEGWKTYRANIDRLAHSTDPTTAEDAIRQINSQTLSLTTQADQVVRAYEAASVARLTWLRTFQVIFLLVGLALLFTGWGVTETSIVRPLDRLHSFARQVGDGNLSSPVEVEGPSEVRLLGETMNIMRAQLLASQQDLQEWASTLENRVQQRMRELEALSAVTRDINSHLSIEEVLTSVTGKARELLGGEVASLCLLDPEGKVLSLHAASAPDIAIQKNQSPANGAVAGTVLNQHCAHLCGMQSRRGFCQIIAPEFRASHLAASLYLRGKVIGALCVGSSKPDAFRPEMVTALTQLSDAAAVALENSRLYQQAEYVATLEERQRIAAEMHDGLLQTMNFLRLMASLMEEQLSNGDMQGVQATLQRIQRAEEQAEREIRRAIDSLQDDFPLNDTLQERLSELTKDLSITRPPVIFESQMLRPLVLSRQEGEQVLRVAREAVLNAQRYSQAEVIHISLARNDHEAVLTVWDQGVGFLPGSSPEDGRAHFGLKIMRARATRLGGRLSIQSCPGVGTEIELRWSPAQWSAGEGPS